MEARGRATCYQYSFNAIKDILHGTRGAETFDISFNILLHLVVEQPSTFAESLTGSDPRWLPHRSPSQGASHFWMHLLVAD